MRLRESALVLASRCSTEILDGRYRLDARIGSGGAADVHRGFDLRLKRAVAVKVFRPGAGAGSEEGLRSEAMLLARLQHPGLVTAYDVGRHDGRAYLVMQLVEGRTLKARIAESPLSCDDTARLGAGLARALAHAHEAGIVHRDVKPSNILLDPSDRPYLTDFGISRLVDATTDTVTGTLVGTAAYLSPEQVLGRTVGRPVDVYALGLVLLECLTGRLEYDGGPLEAAIARLHRPPAVPSGLPAELATLLRDMTALGEQDRPSAPDCARTLATLAGTPLSGHVPTTGPAARTAAIVPSRESARGDHATHRNASPAGVRTAAKAAPARRRVLVAGGTVALVTAMAATLAVTEALPDHGRDGSTRQAVSRPAGSADPEGGSAETNAAPTTPADPSASTREPSGSRLRDVTALKSDPSSSTGRSTHAVGVPRASSGRASGGGAQAAAKPSSAGKKPGNPNATKKGQKAAESKPGKQKQKKQGEDETD
ncbi:protein kinase [Streptomyces asoensis]|uniref:serine/threonine-protein kinase n=1 Tax=Streptomyces asoensis TaxID=249586 RepID=UPI00371FA7EF